jgi:hypothetical protein
MEQHKIKWRGISLAISYTPEKFEMVDHMQLRAEAKVAFPVRVKGYPTH